MKLVAWIMACAFGFAVGCLIGTVSINAIGHEGSMAVGGVLIAALLVALCIITGREGK